MRFGREEPKPGEVWKHHTGLQYKVLGLEKIGKRKIMSVQLITTKVFLVTAPCGKKNIFIKDDRTRNATQVFLEDDTGKLFFISLPVFMNKIGIHNRFERISADV